MTARNQAPEVDLAVIAAFADSEEHVAPATRLTRQRIVVRFALARDGKGLLTAKTADLAAWVDSLEPIKSNTRTSVVGALRAFYAWAIEQGLYSGSDPTAPLNRAAAHIDSAGFGELMMEFRIAQERRALAPSTLAKRREVLRLLNDWLAERSILEATAKDLERFLDTRRIGPRARYDYLSHYHAFYKWAVRSGRAVSDPTEDIERPRIPQNLPRPIPTGDLAAALASARPRMRAWLCLAAYQGLRCHEIAGVQREDVLDQLDPPLLLVRKPKGHRQRMVPLHAATWEALRAAGLPRTGLVFLDDNNGRQLPRPWPGPPPPAGPRALPAWKVSHQINIYLHDIGIEATAHTLRHWFATSVYRATRDLRMTQELLGHSSPTTTARYAAYNPGDAVDVVRGLNA